MAWHQKLTENMADLLRFLARGALLVNAIVLALASVWFIAKFVWFTINFLNRTMFSHPW
jgi:hypothetical protein